MTKKDCFDECPHTECLQNGKDVLPRPFCFADPLIDRYEEQRTIKEPCNTCAHRGTQEPCRRCIHLVGKDMLALGNKTAKEQRTERRDESGTEYHRYRCPYCKQWVDMYGNPKHPLRKVEHTAECPWGTAWKNRK